jgi:hypothetical protein
MSQRDARPEHEIAYQDMVALLRRHVAIPPIEMLAIAANMVGKLVAMQDQRAVTPAQAMKVVADNLEAGNRQVIEELATKTAGRA